MLHRSTMVYAKNTHSSGFYSVHVNAVYLRSGDEEEEKATKLDLTETTLNSGGVIVDSGTTDTYLNGGVAVEFRKVWKSITGFDFKNDKLDLNDEQLAKLPTIIIQLKGDDSNSDVVVDTSEDNMFAAWADPDRPLDILIEIPPYHYMEYDEDEKSYLCRVYIDERHGSVIGANTMQSHDVLFDIDNKRIGWAKSNCDYMVLSGQNKTSDDETSSANQQGFEYTQQDNEFCNSGRCKLGAMTGLVVAALQGMLAWKLFNRKKISAIAVSTKDDGYLDDFDTDISNDDEMFPKTNEII